MTLSPLTRVSPLPSTTRIISHEDGATIRRFVDAMASAFEHTALTRSFSAAAIDSTSSNLATTTATRTIDNKACVLRYIDASVRDAAAREGTVLIEAGEMSAVALWELPQHHHHHHQSKTDDDDNDDEQNAINNNSTPSLRQEYLEKVHLAKQRHIGLVSITHQQQQQPQQQNLDNPPPSSQLQSQLQLRPHYHLEFLGRNPNLPSVPGAISQLVRPFLERAQREGVAVWLEATTPHAVSIYKHFGFRVVQKFVVGGGKRNADGGLEDGGAGVPAWGMIYRVW